MSQRRAIACTTCAKAKTKCDKTIPSCSRCTAKGIVCEPRSTRRTSDTSYRSTKKPTVSPKRFMSTNSIPTISRNGSPRSAPGVNKRQIVRAASQMDFRSASKLGQQTPDFAAMHMLTPLQTYTPHIVDECYSYSSSPEQNLSAFPPSMENTPILPCGNRTPQTPEPFQYPEPVTLAGSMEHYVEHHGWNNEFNMPIGLGFESEMPELMACGPEMGVWAPEFDSHTTPLVTQEHHPAMYTPPVSAGTWPTPALSVAPQQPPHTRAVPSLSISEYSAPESDSPHGLPTDWSCYQGFPGDMSSTTPITTTPYLDSIRTEPVDIKTWDDGPFMRSSTF